MSWESRAGHIDHDSGELIYEQVAADLRALIDSDKTIKRLPSEPDLSEIYQVSRGTIRAAISQLEQDGIVRRVHGRGTFVARDTTSSDRL